jgi:hypothetical protein
MPFTYRNIQFAWLCNLFGVAVILESTSLSEFLIDYGSNVVPGKEKSPVGPKYEVLSISQVLLEDKTKYQDVPMLCLLGLGFLI